MAEPRERERTSEDPSVVVAALGSKLWVDATHVYWLKNAYVLADNTPARFSSCRKDNCSATLVSVELEPDQSFEAVAMQGPQALFRVRSSQRLAIRRCEAGNCRGLDYIFRTADLDGRGLAVDENFVYWAGGQGIHRCPSDAACGMPELIQDGLFYGVWMLGDFLYTASAETPSRVRFASKDDASQPQVVPGLAGTEELTANSTTVYASVYVFPADEGGIWRCEHGECAKGVSLFAPFRAASLHADDDHLYWLGKADGDDGAAWGAWRCKTSGCVAPEPVAAPDAVDIAIDDAEIWWITGTAIHHAPKQRQRRSEAPDD